MKTLINLPSPILYALSALAVLAAAIATNAGDFFTQVYWPIAFWALVAVDFYRTQVVENGESELKQGPPKFADRFIGYLFVAPFIFPARVAQLVAARAHN